ncbi:two-partner secretion domain-containing protein [Pseudomonas sp. Marseille-Q8238]
MNRTYALVWNPSLGTWSVADEHARRRGKGAGAVLAAALLLPGLALAADLPSGGNIVSGSGQIGSPNGNQLTIDQGSNKLAINWQSFDIGAGHKVTFNQPGTDAIALNRVLGADGSKIMGQLDANGRVFIVNPNGVLFGQGASVNVGGLVASTLDLSVSDFEAGNYQFKGDGSNAAVVNQGTLKAADGGSIAMLGGTVSNNGVIVANQGTVALAAGNKVTLDFAGDGLLNVQVDEALIDALVENHQLIRADGGQVLLTANAGEAVLKTVANNTGVIEARTLGEKDGKIVLLGDFAGGTVIVAGTLDASAPNGGNGGFIDTSGAHVKVVDGAKVTTLAADGQTGTWLIDPTDFTVSAGDVTQTDSGIGANTLSNNLNNTSVTLQTVATDNGTDKGDIHVNADITYTANQLTLSAHNAINLNATINVNGTGTLAMNHGAGSINASFHENGGFKGKVNFAGSGAGLLTINGAGYTVIKDMTALQDMSAGNYALGGNLDASSVANFAPIGSFTGTFDGLGHTISGLTINRPDQGNVGLFGSIDNATLRNVGLKGGSVTGQSFVGALVGTSNRSHIHHVYATGNVASSGAEWESNVGGLVGFNKGSLFNVYATGNVTSSGAAGQSNVGGLVGINLSQGGNISVSQAYATGNVTSSGAAGESNVGGLVGSNMSQVGGGTSIIGSFWNTSTTGQGGSAGGGTGKTWAELMQASTFTGWSIATEGGSNAVWRIYEGQTGPLLRSFLQSVTLTADTTKTYDGLSTGTASYTSSLGGNFDASKLSGNLKYTSSSKNAGTYTSAAGTLTLSGLYSGQQGYDISYANSSLTINKAALIVTANDARKTYDGQAWNGGNGVSYSGFANGEDDAVLNGTLSYGGSAQGATNAGTYALSASGLISGNYEIHYQDGALLVSAAPTKTAPPSSSQPYLSVLASNSQTMSTEAEPLTQETEAMEQVTLITNPLDDHLNLQVVNHGIRLPEGI